MRRPLDFSHRAHGGEASYYPPRCPLCALCALWQRNLAVSKRPHESTMRPSEWLPQLSGFCRPEQLRAAMSVIAAYLEQQDVRGDPYQYTPEMWRRARGVEIWAALRLLGRAGLA